MTEHTPGYSDGPFIGIRIVADGEGTYILDLVDAEDRYSDFVWDHYNGERMTAEVARRVAREFAAEWGYEGLPIVLDEARGDYGGISMNPSPENDHTPLPSWAMGRQALEDGYVALQERLEAAEARLDNIPESFREAGTRIMQERARAEEAERLNGELMTALQRALDAGIGGDGVRPAPSEAARALLDDLRREEG